MRRVVDWLRQDLRFSVRTWSQSPGSMAVIVLTLAIGLACNVIAFSLVRALLVRPYPFRDLERLVLLREARAGDATLSTRLTAADLHDVQHESTAFDDVAAYRFLPQSLTGATEPVRVRSFGVSPNLFRLLGVDAARGRTITPGDSQKGTDSVALLSHGLWQRRFGGDPGIVGQRIVLNGRTHEIVGVMAASFNYPRGADLWVPLSLTPSDEQDRLRPTLSALARLRSGTTLRQADLELDRYSRTLAERHPLTNSGRSVRLLRLREEQYEYTLPLFSMLQIAALFVLLVAGANASGIYLVRQLARRPELALRLALGATRPRLIASGLVDAVLLAGLGTAFAIPFSWWAVRAVRDALPRGIAVFVAGWDALRIDAMVLVFSATLSLAAGLTIGRITTLRLPSARLVGLEGVRDVTATGSRRLRRVAVAVQLTIALVLLSAGASMHAGVRRTAQVFNTLEPDHVLVVGVALPVERYPVSTSQADFFGRALDGLRELPSVKAVAAVANLPASNVPNARTSFTIERRPSQSPSEMPSADLQTVGGAFFPLLRIPVLSGRDLLESDTADSMPAVVISKAMAERYWPREDPMGQRIRLGSWEERGPWWTIVGIAGDVKQNWFDPTPRPIVYVPARQRPVRAMSLMVRTERDPRTLARPVKDQLTRLDPAQSLSEIFTLRDEIDDSIAPLRIIVSLLLAFAALTLALAAIGIYGVVASTVVQQTRELGMRLVLGATPSRILAELLGETVRVCGWSVAAGIPILIGLHALVGSKLYNLVSMDLATLAGLTCFLFVVSLCAALVPTRRALSIDPAVALRAL
jgi:putative ABC transport system permease protein